MILEIQGHEKFESYVVLVELKYNLMYNDGEGDVKSQKLSHLYPTPTLRRKDSKVYYPYCDLVSLLVTQPDILGSSK